ncbi:MAG: hypothetical protein AYK19_12380 [Theionarchaea archaeon DG-70-1]|nr:MAG: hypothetical protein AYK19_12380 [Theionarchaea archaeon DG-70-1]
MEVDRMQEREVFVAKGLNKMKKVHFSIRLIETVFIVISESVKDIAVFFITKEDKGNEREQKNEMGGGVSAPIG